MFSVFSVLGLLIMCFLLSTSVSKVTRIPLNIEDIIMPTESAQSELFGSKYRRSEERWAERQKMKAKIDEMKAKGLIKPSEEQDGNPLAGKNFEYISAPRSGVQSLAVDGDKAESDLDITVENLFKSTVKLNKKKGSVKARNESDEKIEKFQKFIYDEKFGITIHNDVTVDYAGTDFGSIMEFIQINTKSRMEYLTRKQLFDSEEFRPKYPENKRKYFVIKDRILDTDELTKPSEEVAGKKKGTTLSLLDRVNKITRATRAKKAPYTFKRKMFGTKLTGADEDEEEDEDQITEQYYEDPALRNDDERWKKANDPKNVENLVANLMKNHEIELKDREKRIKEKSTSNFFQFEKEVTVPGTTEVGTQEPIYEHVILTKKTRFPPSTTTKKSRATKRKMTKNSKKTTLSTKKSSKIAKSTSKLNNDIFRSIILTERAIEKTINTINPFGRNKSFNVTELITLESRTLSSRLRSIAQTVNNTLFIQRMNSSKTFTVNRKNKTSSHSITKSSSKLMTISHTLRAASPTFKKVIIKTIGIRKLTTKLKKSPTTKLKKT